jgi:hypothetical protein
MSINTDIIKKTQKLGEIAREIKKPTPIDTTKSIPPQQIMADKRPSPPSPPKRARDDNSFCCVCYVGDVSPVSCGSPGDCDNGD